ncbi:programmed cell death protein 2-like isoform X2 [Monomorium pharaonis]|uniref:programmed cell death protein 2 isoform X2 n=1 Tax=Monomorium pharaonis TaxID=307658 RepID=UPI00063F0014|nr:programmed cell death protein 2 isoform X2 [Monomorium pharaonis]XP_036150235.1 programmed cell death protein 2-like isoform X2 [Monomorium pharaonis]
MAIDLGFVEKCESWRLQSRFFPSKVGGKPAWLDMKNIPGKDDLECDYCGDPCVFLCQIYAPYEEDANTFHRIVYIFVCKNADCCRPNQNGNLKIFRSQLNRINDFYPAEPPVEQEDWRTDIDVLQWAKTCHVCGILAPNHCGKCKVVNYCSRIHQVYDWKNRHKDTCGIETAKNSDSNFLFPEYEIVIESDDTAKENVEENDSKSEQEEVKKYNAMLQDGKLGIQNENVNDDLLQMANDEKDETFAEFRMKIDNFPDQILRYDRGGKVLYISSHNQITDIPKCQECNGERQFEFQRLQLTTDLARCLLTTVCLFLSIPVARLQTADRRHRSTSPIRQLTRGRRV